MINRVILSRKGQDEQKGNNGISRNRINDIEVLGKEAHGIAVNQKYVIIILSLIAVIALSALLIIHFIKGRQGGFSTGMTVAPGEELMPGSGTASIREYRTDNSALKKAIESYKSGYFANAITGLTGVVESDAKDQDKAVALLYVG